MESNEVTKSLPERFSPSRMKNFLQCPKLFEYTTIMKISTPGSFATFKGTLAHYAFEHIFDFPRGERTPEKAFEFSKAAWLMMTNPLVSKSSLPVDSAEYALREFEGVWEETLKEDETQLKRALRTQEEAALIITDPDKLLREVDAVVTSWFDMETPTAFDPAEREIHVEGKIGEVSMHGLIDRFDKATMPDGTIRYYISDYKTGKKVRPEYEEDMFFQLDVYAALVKDMLDIDVFQLRLIYVQEGRKDAIITRQVTPQRSQRIQKKVEATFKEMKLSLETGDWQPRKSPLCNWCYFQPVCPQWNDKGDEFNRDDIIRITSERNAKG